MSLLPDLKNTGKRQSYDTAPKDGRKPNMILHPDLLVDITRSVAAERTLSVEARTEALKGKYRTQDHTATAPISHLLNNVTSERWAAMSNAAFDGMRKTILNAQNNGKWEIIEYEVDIVKNALDEDILAIGARWTDVLNQQDLAYQNGREAIAVNVKSQIDPSILELLQAKTHASSDPELAAAMKMIAKALEGINKNQFAD